jgi:ubiquinone/menaquinone biosynthesis C-methylase UbiE
MRNRTIDRIKSSLICPACSFRLTESNKGFACEKCKRKYTVTCGIPVLTASGSTHKEDEAAYHSSVSSCYADLHQLDSYRNKLFHLRALSPILLLSPHATIIELGCGTGVDAVPLLAAGHLVVETDIAPGQVNEARKRIVERGLGKRALFYVADAERIPFADATFDAAFTVASLHHLENPLKGLKEMRRCTRPSGTIVIAMEPNTYEWVRIFSIPFSIAKLIAFHLVGRKRLRKALGRADKFREPAIESTFSRRELRDLALESGLTVKKIEPVWFLCGFIQWLITLLNKLSTRYWSINKDIERLCVHFDGLIAALPVVNLFCCNWTLHCTRE